jgi:nicotinic acid mononucleotide adenylyltransferase
LTSEQRKILGNPRFRYLKISGIDPERVEREFDPRRVLLVEVVSLDIASREIRDLVEQGRSIRHLVPDTVAAYMAKNRLYQRPQAARSRA